MIFVTVGTTKFDALIREVDALAERGVLKDRVLCQIGSGEFEPRNVEHFRFRSGLQRELSAADLVITHGGSTPINLLQLRKRFVAIANTDLADDHQSKFLEQLARHTRLHWSREVRDLEDLVRQALANPAPVLDMPPLALEIDRQIEALATTGTPMRRSMWRMPMGNKKKRP